MTAADVVEALVPFWAAETEICRAHLATPDRSMATDAEWLARQAAKELHDGVVPRVDRVRARAASMSAAALVLETEELHEEAVHYAAFARAHDVVASAAGLPLLAERTLDVDVAWSANAALAELRRTHEAEHGRAGSLATTLTEGGCSSLFAVGVALAGGGPVDDAIAEACAAVFADEVDHVRTGLEALDEASCGVDAVDAALVAELAVAQSRLRLQMRQEQFGHPVGTDRFAELLAGSVLAADLAAVESRLGRSATTSVGA